MAVAIGLVALALLIVAAVLVGTQDPKSYPDDSPEVTVQAYFQALIDDQPLDAYELFSEELQARCAPPTQADIAYLTISRVVLDEVETEGDRSVVRVSVTQEGTTTPFGSDEWTSNESLRLTDSSEGWRISYQPWPISCGSEN